MTASITQLHPTRQSVQLSGYPQDDNSTLYAVEALNTDGTWDLLDISRDNAEGWRRAAKAAHELGLPLLPVSTFPGGGGINGPRNR